MYAADTMSQVADELLMRWVRLASKWTTVYVARDAAADERVQQVLHASDDLVEALRKLLSPGDDHAGAPVRIFLVHGDAPGDPDAACGEGFPRGAIMLDLDSGPPLGRLAGALTRRLIAGWFGEQAASADLFMDGIAGMAAAHSGAGPGVDEADRLVDEELRAGRVVSVMSEPAGRRRKRRVMSVHREAAATSFVADLYASFGAEALRLYLRTYDSARHDQAAAEAYHQPLSLLEQEWLARRRRHGRDGDVFRPFMRYIVPLLKPYRWRLIEILAYLLLAAAYNVVLPYAVKVVIDRLAAPVRAGAATPRFFATLGPLLMLLLGIYIVNGIVSLRRAYTVSKLNQDILNNLQIQMYGHLLRLSHGFHVRARLGDLMARISDDVSIVQQALGQVTNKALYQTFTVAGALTALFMLTHRSPVMAVPILLIMPLFAVSYVGLRTRNKQASREQRKRASQTMATVQESLAAHALIKAFGLEERFVTDYRVRVLALQKSKIRLAILSAITDLSADMTTALAQLIVIGVGGYLVLRDGGRGLGVGDLAALLVLVKSIFSPIASLSGIGQTMQQATGAMERVVEVFREPVRVADKPGATELTLLTEGIRLDNVTFDYGGARRALRGLSLTIPAGAHVAIVGPSGAGKSSVVNLIMRFWDPERGRVLFDGHDLRDVTLQSLRRQIGLVFQETFILNTTLRANIAIGRPDATDAEIAAAAKAARLDAFIDSLPAGYDTIAGEAGAQLSTGQKQRIAIARAFLRDPPILILDEATSALDAQTETEIMDTLSELATGRTTISITHRISQAATADWIFVLDQGSLVEQGTHAELISAEGLYHRLYEDATSFATGETPSSLNDREERKPCITQDGVH